MPKMWWFSPLFCVWQMRHHNFCRVRDRAVICSLILTRSEVQSRNKPQNDQNRLN